MITLVLKLVFNKSQPRSRKDIKYSTKEKHKKKMERKLVVSSFFLLTLNDFLKGIFKSVFFSVLLMLSFHPQKDVSLFILCRLSIMINLSKIMASRSMIYIYKCSLRFKSRAIWNWDLSAALTSQVILAVDAFSMPFYAKWFLKLSLDFHLQVVFKLLSF